MMRSRQERIAVLEAQLLAPVAATRPKKRSVRARVRATRVLLEEAFVLIKEADQLLAKTEGHS
jgi:hypothetical protein